MIQNTRRADFRCKCGNAGIDEGVGQYARVSRVIEDLIDRKQLRHRADFWQVHSRYMERRHVNSGRRGMKVDRVVGIRLEQPVEHYPGVPRWRRETVLIPRPLAIEVDAPC